MPRTGTLRSWNDERGFGFIAPTGGGPEVFVHISALPRDGSRPTVGETLDYELGRGKDGRPAAVRVVRRAIGNPAGAAHARRSVARRHRSPFVPLIGVLLLVALGTYGYSKVAHRMSSPAGNAAAANGDSSQPGSTSPYRCDGRTYCSQMTSCSEAKFFLENCPGTRMDGNHDGVPCERQWCTSPFAK